MGTHSSGPEDFETFEELFDLDVRVEYVAKSSRCSNHTNDGCSQSCPSVGCTATCNCR